MTSGRSSAASVDAPGVPAVPGRAAALASSWTRRRESWLFAVAVALCASLPACASSPYADKGRLLTALCATNPLGVCAAGTQLSEKAVIGHATRVALWVTNVGAAPALLLGATPQTEGDDDVSFVENRRGLPVYDGEKETLTVVRARFAGDRFTLHHGLLLPGETVRVYSTVYPRDTGWSVCRYQLDYLSVPWEVALRSIYVARDRLPGGRRVYRRLRRPSARPEDRDPPRLRRAIVTARHETIRRCATRFRVVIGSVTRPGRALPRLEAKRLAGVPERTPLLYSEVLGGWAFSSTDGPGVRVVKDDGELASLPWISLRALREINRSTGAVSIVVDAPEAWAQLGHLVAGLPEVRAVGVRSLLTVVPRSLLPELLKTAQGAGLKLEAIARPHGLSVRTPGVGLLFARR